jgi:protein TonB
MEINRAPAYPQSALRRGEQGNVMLRVNVSAGGAPLSVDLAATSGYASLDGAAEAAVGQWRFNPATRGGIPVAAIADVPIRFRLTN